ncbi:siderophore-interacting protein [Nocardioides mangrovicus]|uniref:Siderophore-interacting protein n=1 Tax=Nocardioides mangrovicus TaxID=2478913 RepID=A0A3L8P2K3_9ACTN|nr:siderophore-interacting protein [Nocardioides mangrovicus]RLV49570.1 siderophore-interacting protein [Nocardioides mangrovicus]
MSHRTAPLPGRVTSRRELTAHLVRLEVEVPGWHSSGVLDEWVALTVPGQYQTRYYTVRDVEGERLVLDVVIHDEGLVTTWAAGDCVGDQVLVSLPQGSFALPDDAGWLVLAADLTGLPAVARIAAHHRVTAYVEAPAGTEVAYDPIAGEVTWVEPPAHGSGQTSALADLVSGLTWPAGPGYFWMAGESAQMREIRKHLRHEVGFETTRFDVMGYWSGARGRRLRAS